MAISETLTRKNRSIIKVDAVLIRSFRLKDIMTVIIKAAVKIIEKCGVLDFAFIFWKNPGRRKSRLIAMAFREAVKIPAFAVVTKARIAAKASTTLPAFPAKVPAASERGVKELDSS